MLWHVIQLIKLDTCSSVVYTSIHRAFTVFGPLLTVLLLHQRRTSDFWTQYVNNTMKSIQSIWMDVNLWSRHTEVSLRGHCSNGVVGLVYTLFSLDRVKFIEHWKTQENLVRWCKGMELLSSSSNTYFA